MGWEKSKKAVCVMNVSYMPKTAETLKVKMMCIVTICSSSGDATYFSNNVKIIQFRGTVFLKFIFKPKTVTSFTDLRLSCFTYHSS